MSGASRVAPGLPAVTRHPAPFLPWTEGPAIMQFYRIRNWKKYQHYSKRSPPWIKLHTKILNSPRWFSLSLASRLLVFCVLIVGSKYDGRVPVDCRLLAKLCRLPRKPNLQPLIDVGFLELDASIVQADASALSTETEYRDRERDRVHIPRVKKRAVKEPADDGEFERFWAAYPRHVGKPKALKAFQAAIGKTTIETILAALKWQCEAWRDPQYIPHPTTWLNREGWNDERTLFKGSNGNGHETIIQRGRRLYEQALDIEAGKVAEPEDWLGGSHEAGDDDSRDISERR